MNSGWKILLIVELPKVQGLLHKVYFLTVVGLLFWMIVVDTIEDRLNYKDWFCGHRHIDKLIDIEYFMMRSAEALWSKPSYRHVGGRMIFFHMPGIYWKIRSYESSDYSWFSNIFLQFLIELRIIFRIQGFIISYRSAYLHIFFCTDWVKYPCVDGTHW